VIRQGDVYWLDLADPVGTGPGYRRPVVVVQNDLFNESRLGTTMVCTLTSNLRHAAAPGNVFVPAGEGGLAQDSVALVIQVFTVDKAILEESLGSLPPQRVHQIVGGVRFAIEPSGT
jgi:mRNA interferase MazF